MGLILLVGLIVKNGIILLDAARHFLDSGMATSDAILEAGRIRLRPILMTTLCTLAGLIPLASGWVPAPSSSVRSPSRCSGGSARRPW